MEGESFLKHQIAIRHCIANFAQFAKERKAKNLWRIDETHGVAGIFLTLAESLGSDMPTRKELSRHGELRESRDRALKKRRSMSAPSLEWDVYEEEGLRWSRATSDPGNWNYAEFLAYLVRRRSLFEEMRHHKESLKAASRGDVVEASLGLAMTREMSQGDRPVFPDRSISLQASSGKSVCCVREGWRRATTAGRQLGALDVGPGTQRQLHLLPAGGREWGGQNPRSLQPDGRADQRAGRDSEGDPCFRQAC